jgi:DNA-binding MarR family transcriptional regulator
MPNAPHARAGTFASKQKVLNKKQFIQYEPELAEELTEKKSNKQSVSGRLLTILYKRLLFWSRYAKHQYNGRRYFWKSISELSEEVFYSTKQVARGLKALEELGMIKREKLNKHNWKHTYYYYLPKSVHTAEQAPAGAAPSTSSSRSDGGIKSSSCMPLQAAAAVSATSTATTDQERDSSTSSTRAGTLDASIRSGVAAAASNHQKPAAGESVQPFRQQQRSQNVPFISRENNPLLINQLRDIVEKCLDYSLNPPKPITKGGVGFANQVL